jgi:hypothetical protein
VPVGRCFAETVVTYDQLIDKGWGSVHVIVVCIAVQGLRVGIGVAIGNLPAAIAVGVTAAWWQRSRRSSS